MAVQFKASELTAQQISDFLALVRSIHKRANLQKFYENQPRCHIRLGGNRFFAGSFGYRDTTYIRVPFGDTSTFDAEFDALLVSIGCTRASLGIAQTPPTTIDQWACGCSLMKGHIQGCPNIPPLPEREAERARLERNWGILQSKEFRQEDYYGKRDKA